VERLFERTTNANHNTAEINTDKSNRMTCNHGNLVRRGVRRGEGRGVGQGGRVGKCAEGVQQMRGGVAARTRVEMSSRVTRHHAVTHALRRLAFDEASADET
jgi:hypothetical protein